jgi:predicted transcriptional regulator
MQPKKEMPTMITNDRPIEQLFIWLLTKTRGGKTRTQIIQTLKITPKNTNQLAVYLNKSYKTISHHITVLEKNKLIVPIGDTYATTYFLSSPMEANYQLFKQVTSKSNQAKKKLKVLQR